MLKSVLPFGLKQLWGMLNSQQIFIYMPMLEMLKMPGNVMVVEEQLVKVFTFDLLPTEYLDEQIWYFPDEDAFSLNF